MPCIAGYSTVHTCIVPVRCRCSGVNGSLFCTPQPSWSPWHASCSPRSLCSPPRLLLSHLARFARLLLASLTSLASSPRLLLASLALPHLLLASLVALLLRSFRSPRFPPRLLLASLASPAARFARCLACCSLRSCLSCFARFASFASRLACCSLRCRFVCCSLCSLSHLSVPLSHPTSLA